jgi:hemerythrin
MNSIKIHSISGQSWNDSFLLNIDVIDNQHKKFFELFDLILALNKSKDAVELSSVINELQDYAQYHFETEETLMQNADSENFELHIIQHQFFINKINEFTIAQNYNNPVLTTQIVVFMRKWLLMHITETDKRYVESVQSFLLKNESN